MMIVDRATAERHKQSLEAALANPLTAYLLDLGRRELQANPALLRPPVQPMPVPSTLANVR